MVNFWGSAGGFARKSWTVLGHLEAVTLPVLLKGQIHHFRGLDPGNYADTFKSIVAVPQAQPSTLDRPFELFPSNSTSANTYSAARAQKSTSGHLLHQ